MPDKFDQHWTLWLRQPGATDNAVTIGQTTYYSVPKEVVDKDHAWRAHEDEHKRQWARDGHVGFALKYLWWLFRRGYWNNPYEVEARAAAEKIKGDSA